MTSSKDRFFLRLLLVLAWWVASSSKTTAAGALESYVGAADNTYSWRIAGQETNDFTVAHLEMNSQTWRSHLWTHHLTGRRPRMGTNDVAFLFVTGDGDGKNAFDVALARRGAPVRSPPWSRACPISRSRRAAGRRAVAYTFDQFLRSGDDYRPLLFPMVKTAVRAMDTVQTCGQRAEDRASWSAAPRSGAGPPG
jgi:PhoPQ-activated pathogenicity-related protein